MVLLAALMIPFQVIMAPLVGVLHALGWLDTFQGFIVPNIPSIFGAFLFRQFFMGIPLELEEADRIDGCGHFRTLVQIVLPLSLPVISTFILIQLEQFFLPTTSGEQAIHDDVAIEIEHV